jgi:hypothetical protein
MPSPGWYPDPEQASTWRWWDGAKWTEQRAPMWVQPTRDPRSFSAWFDRSFRCVTSVVRRVGLVVFGVWAALGLAATVVVVAAFRSDRGRELRGLLDGNLSTGGSMGLTDAEADRVWELVGELFWSVLPWAIVLVGVYAVVAAWTYAWAAQVAAASSGDVGQGQVLRVGAEQPGADEPKPSVRSALRRVPAVLAATLVLGSIALGVFAAVSLPVVLMVAVDAGGAAIGLTAFFCVIAGMVIGVWLWVRLGLAVVVAALGGHGLGINRSRTLTHGRFWFVFARLLVAGLIAGALGGVASILGNFFGLFGLVVGAAIVLVLTAVVDALRAIVSASAHVVIVDQIDEIDETNRATGSSVPGGHT